MSFPRRSDFALHPADWSSLVVNIFASEVVEPARRTLVFGMLQGAIMIGQGLGYLCMVSVLIGMTLANHQ